MNGKPDQKISYKEKIKDINKVNSWSARTLDYYIASTGFTQTSVRGRNIKMLYDAYNGVMPQEYFNHVTNPLNNPNGEYSFPSKIRPYPLLRPNIDLLRGEFIKRPFNWTIKRTGEDAYNEKYDKLYKQVLTNIKQHFVNELVQTGIAPEEAEQQVSYPDEVKTKFSSNYKDEKAYKAQKLLEHFMYKYDIKEELNRGFLDYLIAGEAYFYTYPCDGDLEFKRVSTKGKTNDCPDRTFVVYLAEEADVDILLSDKFSKPSFDWAETFCTMVGNRIRIYTNGEFDVISPRLNYYRKPVEVQFKECINLNTGTTVTADVQSEFKDDIIELICDEAASILAGDIESVMQYQRNEKSAERNN